jgi:hypothetical protein
VKPIFQTCEPNVISKKASFSGILPLLLASAAFAGETRTAKYANEFMSLGVGGRALGMGGAYCALATDVSAGYWNPAGLTRIDYPQIMLMHTEQFDQTLKYDYGSFAIPVGANRSLGLGLIRIGIDDIPVTRLQNPSLPLGAIYVDEDGFTRINRPYVASTISDAEYAMYLSYGVKRSERFSFGVNAKILRKSVGENSAWGLGFDVAALCKPVGNLQLGFNFQDITTTVLAWNQGTREIIIPTLKAGLTYPVAIPMLNGYMSPAIDFDIRFEGRDYASQFSAGAVSVDTHFGWEYQFQEVFALRLGSDIGRFAAGAGINLPKLQVDYAFIGHEDLGETHRISARFTIEAAKFRRAE